MPDDTLKKTVLMHRFLMSAIYSFANAKALCQLLPYDQIIHNQKHV